MRDTNDITALTMRVDPLRQIAQTRQSCEMALQQDETELVFDFEPFAERFVRVTENNAYNAQYERPALRSLLVHSLVGRSVLDVGCAGGAHSEYFVGQGAIVTALDISPTMVRLASRRLGHRAKVRRADIRQRLDMPDASFDVVVCSLTMHYIRNWEPILSEFRRVLRPMGKFVMSTNHPHSEFCRARSRDAGEIRLVEQEWTDFGPLPITARFYTRPLDMMITSLETAGFTIGHCVEPAPAISMATSNPGLYHKLSREHWFLLLSAYAIPGGPRVSLSTEQERTLRFNPLPD